MGSLVTYGQCLWATIPTYNLALVLTKISIVCQYRRIFTTQKVVRLCNIMIGVLIFYGCWAVLGKRTPSGSFSSFLEASTLEKTSLTSPVHRIDIHVHSGLKLLEYGHFSTLHGKDSFLVLERGAQHRD